jgi:DNA-binding winged helix-turn-helix (wHTH) protein
MRTQLAFSAHTVSSNQASEVGLAVVGSERQPEEYRFGDFVLVPALFELRRLGRRLHVAPKVFDLILYLVENHDRVVTHADFRAQLWPGVTVTDSSLTYTVMAARRALGDEGRRQAFIRNVRSRGYRFVAALSDAQAAGARLRAVAV